MLEEALSALAAAGGTAVVQAAGSDAWDGLRDRVARLLDRDDRERHDELLARLDLTAAAVAPGRATELVMARQQSIWQSDFETLLGSLAGDERAQAAEQLREAVGLNTRSLTEIGSSRDATVQVSGDAVFRADGGSVSAAVITGGVHLVNPRMPGPEHR